jgi:hypothetical protein
MMMSVCTNPYHPFFWLRLGGMRRRWERTRISRGWGGGGGGGGGGGPPPRQRAHGRYRHDETGYLGRKRRRR